MVAAPPASHWNTRQPPNMELQPHQHFATHIDPSCSLRKIKLQNTLSIASELQKQFPKKGPKVRKHGVAVFGQARVRTRGRGMSWEEA